MLFSLILISAPSLIVLDGSSLANLPDNYFSKFAEFIFADGTSRTNSPNELSRKLTRKFHHRTKPLPVPCWSHPRAPREDVTEGSQAGKSSLHTDVRDGSICRNQNIFGLFQACVELALLGRFSENCLKQSSEMIR